MVTRKKSIRRQTLCSKIIHFPFFFFLLSFAFTESYERINISFFTYLVCQRSFLKFSFEILSSTLTHYRPKLVPLRMSYIMSTAVVDDFNLPLTFSTASQTWNWPQTEGLQLLSRIRKKKLSITGIQMHFLYPCLGDNKDEHWHNSKTSAKKTKSKVLHKKEQLSQILRQNTTELADHAAYKVFIFWCR